MTHKQGLDAVKDLRIGMRMVQHSVSDVLFHAATPENVPGVWVAGRTPENASFDHNWRVPEIGKGLKDGLSSLSLSYVPEIGFRKWHFIQAF
jgi:hypothetical protein